MALKHDKDGFLVGRGGKDVLQIIHDNTKDILAQIHGNIKPPTNPQPRLKIGVQIANSAPKPRAPKAPSTSFGLKNRDAQGQFVNANSDPTHLPAATVKQNKVTSDAAVDAKKSHKEQIKLLKRIANRGSSGDTASKSPQIPEVFGGGKGKMARFFGRTLGRAGRALKGAGGKLLGGAAMAKLGGFFGRGAPKGGLDGADAKAAKAGGIGSKLLGGLKGIGGGARAVGGLLKRIPLIGAAITGLFALSDMDTIDKDGSLNQEQRDTKKAGVKGGAVGTLGGMAAGAAIGTMIFPGVGTVIGGIIGGIGGEKIGKTVGEWLYKRDWKSAWDSTRTKLSTSFDSMTGGISGMASVAWKGFSALWTTSAKQAIDKAKEFVAPAVEAAGQAIDAVKAAYNGQEVQGANADGSQTKAQQVGGAVGRTANYLTGAAKDSLSGFIGKGEGDYNSVNLGKAHGYKASKRNLTGMSLDAVLAGQKNRSYNAVGKYQIIRDTMPEVVKGLGLTGKETFDEKLQDQMGAWLAFHKRKKLGDFLSGKHNDINAAGDDAAREWASLPVFSNTLTTGKYHSKRGATAYSDGVNKSSHSVEDTQKALLAAKATYQAAIKSGKNKNEAEYLAFTGLSSNITQPAAAQNIGNKIGSVASAPSSGLGSYLDSIKKLGVQCVDLVKSTTGNTGSTQNWRRGQAAEQGTLKQGDALATFLSGGKKKDYNTYALSDKYGGGTGGAMGWNKDHAVIFDKYNYDKEGKIESMSVFEQYKKTGGKVVPNTYKFGTGINNEKNASMYYGVNVAGKALKVPPKFNSNQSTPVNRNVGQVQVNTPSIAAPSNASPPPILTAIAAPKVPAIPAFKAPDYVIPTFVAANTSGSNSKNGNSGKGSDGFDYSGANNVALAQIPVSQRVSNDRIAWTAGGGIGMG